MSEFSASERFRQIRTRPVVLEVKGLRKEFAHGEGGSAIALMDVDFTVHRREFITVIGPSGCGKSTLVRILAGLEGASAGEVLIDGSPVHGPGCERGMVFQGYTLFPWLTVVKNVMFGLEMGGMSKEQAQREAMQWLEMVGLQKFSDAYPYQLSGGMKQRVAIVRALANNPRILLMDEPFGALDPQTRMQMQSYLLQIWRNVNVTIVFITHDLDEAVLLAGRIIVLGAADETHPGGHLIDIVEVPLSPHRDVNITSDPLFQQTRARLDALIHPHAAIAADRLPMLKMTEAGDDV